MGRGVGIEALEPLGDRQHGRHFRVGGGRLAEPRLVGHRLLQAHRLGGVLRHQLGELVDLAKRHLQHPADVAHHAAGEERAEGDDLRDAVLAVALAHIGDHLVAPVLTEVDVEVGHRHALGIEKALEQQPEPQRVEVGDGQRPGDQRAGPRAAPRADRDSLRFGPFDEVGDDQEVAGKLHPGDDVELEVELLAVVVGDMAGRAAEARKMALEPLGGLAAQLAFLVDLGAVRRAEMGQDRLAGQRPVAAAQGDLDAVVDRLLEVGEQRPHLGAGLEAMVGGQAAALAGAQQRALGDGEQRVLRLVVGGGGEKRLVGRHQRQAVGVGEVDQCRLDPPLAVEPMALHFDVEPTVE